MSNLLPLPRRKLASGEYESRIMNYAVNCVSLLNVACGFASVIFSLEGRFIFAAWAIIIAAVFDGLDGLVAKRHGWRNDFGKQLDSLADVVSFGIAPAVLGYQLRGGGFNSLATSILFIYVCCGILRLARYNSFFQQQIRCYFYGLPITISGGALALCLLLRQERICNFTFAAFSAGVIILAILMISRIKYPNLQGLAKALKVMPWLNIVIVLSAGCAIIGFYIKTGMWSVLPGLFVLLLMYLAISPVLARDFV